MNNDENNKEPYYKRQNFLLWNLNIVKKEEKTF